METLISSGPNRGITTHVWRPAKHETTTCSLLRVNPEQRFLRAKSVCLRDMASANLAVREEVNRDETIARLDACGLHGRQLVNLVLEYCGHHSSALEAFITASLVSERTRRAVPWRMPSIVVPAIEAEILTAFAGLPQRNQRALELVAASHELPTALRRDSIDRAFRAAELSHRDLYPAGDAGLLTSGQRIDLIVAPVIRCVLETQRTFPAALARIAEVTPAGHDRVRIAARAALPGIDPALSATLEQVALERRSSVDLLVTAQDLDVAAQLAEATDRGRILIDVADVLHEANFLQAAIVALDEAESLLHDKSLRARALALRGKVELSLGDPIRSAATQVRVAEMLIGSDDRLAASSFMGAAGCLVLTTRATEALRLARRARELAGNDAVVLLTADVLEGVLLVRSGDCELARPYLDTLESLCQQTVTDPTVTDIGVMEHLLWVHHSSLLSLERFDDCRTFGQQLLSLAKRLDRTQLRQHAVSTMVLLAWAQGDVNAAIAWLPEFGDATSPVGGSEFIHPLVVAPTLVEEPPTGATSNDDQVFGGEIMWEGFRTLAAGIAAFARDDPTIVRASLEALLRDLVQGGCRNFGYVGWLTLLVEAQLETGARHAAVRTAELQDDLAARSNLTYHRVPALRAAALLADHDEALWERAIIAHENWGNPIELAHTLRSRGEQILRRPPSVKRSLLWDRAEVDLGRAAFLFGESGATGFGHRCEKRLAELRSQRKAERPSLDVSDREMDVVALVQSGATNREVAAKLSVSLKTVESHLRNIFKRNDLRNRAELIARNKPQE